MKPHCMFFDEVYSEHYYREKTTMEVCSQKMDCLIVIGTALATSGARKVVYDALGKQNIPVIEFNIEPAITEGYTLNITEKCETSIKAMFKEYYRLSSLSSQPVKKTGLLSPNDVKTTSG